LSDERGYFKEYVMKNLANLITSVIIAIWIVAIAIICTQNAESISLKFLSYESIKLPFGLVLSFSVALGILVTAIFLPVLSLSTAKTSRKTFLEDDPEFFTDDEDF
jgi:uncharacterized integral membrane protein